MRLFASASADATIIERNSSTGRLGVEPEADRQVGHDRQSIATAGMVEADRRERRPEREVEAGLQTVEDRRANGGEAPPARISAAINTSSTAGGAPSRGAARP